MKFEVKRFSNKMENGFGVQFYYDVFVISVGGVFQVKDIDEQIRVFFQRIFFDFKVLV